MTDRFSYRQAPAWKMTMDVPPGTNIETAAAAAQDYADRIGGSIMFEFNSVQCIAVPAGSVLNLVELQQEASRTPRRVFSDDPPPMTGWGDASAGEAGTAETTKIGSVHEHAVPQADAQ